MDPLANQLRAQLLDATAAVAILGRGSRLSRAEDRGAVAQIRSEVRSDRAELMNLAKSIEMSWSGVSSLRIAAAAHLDRRKPTSSARGSTLADVEDLKAMRDIASARAAGCEALAQSTRLCAMQLDLLTNRARLQHATLSELHVRAAQRLLSL